MDRNSPLISSRNLLESFLKTRSEFSYIDIRKSYINTEVDLPLKRPLVTISKGTPLTNAISFGDYLDEEFNELENKFIETRGKELNIFFDIHIWNSTTPKMGGEKTIERIQESLMTIFEFESNAIPGITFFEFTEGTPDEDIDGDLFHSRCRLHVKTLWKHETRHDVIDEIFPHADIKE